MQGFVAHVAGKRCRLAALSGDLVGKLRKRILVAGGDDDLCRLARKEQRGGAADTRACAGDDRDLTFQSRHDSSPSDCVDGGTIADAPRCNHPISA